MKRLNLEQGSQAWHDHRATAFNASEAPAMLGKSPYMSRNQLLDLKKGKAPEPVNSIKQAIFQSGHDAENAQRPFFELSKCEAYPPAVCVNAVGDIELSASFDGLNIGGDAWEHKLWNKTLAENVRNGVLAPLHYFQLESQMLVNGKDSIYFTCSDGTAVNVADMVYESVAERRAEVLAGWKQFKIDLESHVIEAKEETVAPRVVENLPVPSIEVKGSDIISNLDIVLVKVQERIEYEKGRTLDTDSDFGERDDLVRKVKALRDSLESRRVEVIENFNSLATFTGQVKSIDTELQQFQSFGMNQVKTAKAEKISSIISGALDDVRRFETECNGKLSPLTLDSIFGDFFPDFKASTKGVRTMNSAKDKCSDAVATLKASINPQLDVILINLDHLRAEASDHKFLFHDVSKIVNRDSEGFRAIVGIRISDHKAEQKRLEEKRLEEKRLEEKRLEEKRLEEKRLEEAPIVAEPVQQKPTVETEVEATVETSIESPVETSVESPALSHNDMLLSDLSQWATTHGVNGPAMIEICAIIETHTTIKED